jgi:succinyl-CoA synthetase beta subunit
VVPRKKISEFRAKSLLSRTIGLAYDGLSIDSSSADLNRHLSKLSRDKTYVIKVDQGVKGRFKKGLVLLDRPYDSIEPSIKALRDEGYRYFIVEEYRRHEAAQEYYLAMERTRAGNMVMFSRAGGVEIEANASSIAKEPLMPTSADKIESTLDLPKGTLDKLSAAFDSNYFSFLEINPLVVLDHKPYLLDAAVEVDDEAAPFVNGRWTVDDFRDFASKSSHETAVEELEGTSQASFRLKVLNPDGAVFLLLSGGGASIVVADEVYNQGSGKELANYGEYSGNPSEEETYLYTREIVRLMLDSKAHHKVLIIGGGVANFTDVRVTFRGVIRALDEAKVDLKRQQIKVFVRRGGPHEAEGLAMIQAFLIREGLHGLVAGPEVTLSSIVPAALKSLNGGHA